MHHYSRWEDAMIAQTRLLDSYRTSRGLKYLEGVFHDMNLKHKPDERRDIQGLMAIQMQKLIRAEPIYVGIEAAEIIDHARHSFEPEPVLPSDPFVPCGFALLPKPLIINDAPRTEKHPGRSIVGIPVRAIAWLPIHDEEIENGCFWISYYVSIDDEVQLGDDRWAVDEISDMHQFMPLGLVHTWQWTWGNNPYNNIAEFAVWADDDLEEVQLRARQQQQLIQTLWRIGSQFVPAKQRPIRQIRRDARRKGLRHEEVNIVTLRRSREYEESEGDSGRHYHVRFPVRGYWAKRHTREGTKQVWVRPHMKGPEDGELVVKDRAWEFLR